MREFRALAVELINNPDSDVLEKLLHTLTPGDARLLGPLNNALRERNSARARVVIQAKRLKAAIDWMDPDAV